MGWTPHTHINTHTSYVLGSTLILHPLFECVCCALQWRYAACAVEKMVYYYLVETPHMLYFFFVNFSLRDVCVRVCLNELNQSDLVKIMGLIREWNKSVALKYSYFDKSIQFFFLFEFFFLNSLVVHIMFF